MSEFKIKTGNALNVADDIIDCAALLSDCESEVSSVMNSIGSSLGSSSVGIMAQLSELCTQLNNQDVNLTNLGLALKKIVEDYIRTEKLVVAGADGIKIGSSCGVLESTAIDTTICRDTKGRQDLLNTSDSDKDSVISEFEKKHPTVRDEFDRFLLSGDNNLLTDDDKRNIKYLVYTADEPYRSVFLSCIKEYEIDDGNLDKSAFYSSGIFSKDLTYDYPDSFGSDPRGPFTTFFHECGHCIDDLADISSYFGYDTASYEFYSEDMGKNVTLYDTIIYDVYFNENNPHSITSIGNTFITKGDKDAEQTLYTVVLAFAYGANPDDLLYKERVLYKKILEYHNNSCTSGVIHEAVTDVYGGASHNALRNGGYGHENTYWENKNKLGKELWAEYFSYNMARSDEALENLKEFFPESAKLMDDYSNSFIVINN